MLSAERYTLAMRRASLLPGRKCNCSDTNRCFTLYHGREQQTRPVGRPHTESGLVTWQIDAAVELL